MPINSYSSEVSSYFNKNFKKPFYSQFVKQPDGLSIGIEVHGVKAGLNLGSFLNWIADPFRLEYATWKWLRPDTPVVQLNELTILQLSCGLSHMDSKTFARELLERCREHLRDHPLLRFWIEKRASLLELQVESLSPTPEALQDSLANYRQGLMQAIAHLCSGHTDEALALAFSIGDKVLAGASTATASVLFNGDCELQANLMLPSQSPLILSGADYERIENNAAAAQRLWAGCPTPQNYLVVVDETGDADKYLGFWVPVCRGESGRFLPGAPQAFETCDGSAVFKDDPPPLEGFSSKIASDWVAYMNNDFEDQMFVSLPFTVLDSDKPKGKRTIAVLNLNVQRHNGNLDRRSYHKEWLTIARGRVSPFIEIAYWCMLIKITILNTTLKLPYFDLKTGLPDWNTLPGVSFYPEIELDDDDKES